MKMHFLSFMKFLLIIIMGASLLPAATIAAENSQMFFILDGSGSMWGDAGGQTKIEAAREVMNTLVPSLPPELRIGLAAYGHRRKGDCKDIEVLMRSSEGNRDELLSHVQSIRPKGKTPIADTIKLVVETVKTDEAETVIVLVSDGKETCEPDPCGVVRALKETGINFILHAVGFGVKGEAVEQLQCIAQAGGGRYFQADDVAGLNEALTTVAESVVTGEALPPPPKKKVRHISLSTGTLSISNLSGRTVAVCEPDSSCYNTASDGWVGVISPETKNIKVKAGTYKLKFQNHYLQGVEVIGGQTTDVLVGTLSISNLSGRTVAVCEPDSKCYNYANNGWVGVVSPEVNSLEVPTGTYKLKFQNHYLQGVEVIGGQTTDVLVAAISMPSVSEKIAVCTPDSDCYNYASNGWVGVISTEANSLEVPAGTYKLKMGKQYIEDIQVEAGEELVIE